MVKIPRLTPLLPLFPLVLPGHVHVCPRVIDTVVVAVVAPPAAVITMEKLVATFEGNAVADLVIIPVPVLRVK